MLIEAEEAENSGDVTALANLYLRIWGLLVCEMMVALSHVSCSTGCQGIDSIGALEQCH